MTIIQVFLNITTENFINATEQQISMEPEDECPRYQEALKRIKSALVNHCGVPERDIHRGYKPLLEGATDSFERVTMLAEIEAALGSDIRLMGFVSPTEATVGKIATYVAPRIEIREE